MSKYNTNHWGTEVPEYFKRQGVKLPDGSVSMASKKDLALEKVVLKTLEEKWKCNIGSFGRFAPLDMYAMRDGELAAVFELKTHDYAIDKYQSVSLNLRKYGWMALYSGLGVSVIYLKMFQTYLYFVNFKDIEIPEHIKMGGCRKWFKSCTDQEPMIYFPRESMKCLGQVILQEEYDKLIEIDRKTNAANLVKRFGKEVKQQ